MPEKDMDPYVTQRVKRETHRLLKIVAAISGSSVLELIDRLVREEISRQKYRIPGE